MKNILLLIVVLTLTLSISNNTAFSQIKLGIHGGIVSSTQDITPSVPSTTNKTGFNAGAHIEVPINKSFKVMPGIQYSSKGVKYPSGSGMAEENLNYIEIPVWLKYQFGGSSFKTYVETAPTIGFLTSATVDRYSSSGQLIETNNVEQSYNSTDFGVKVGAGAELPIGTKTDLFGSVNYHYGLSNSSSIPNQDWKNRGIEVYVGVKFGLNR